MIEENIKIIFKSKDWKFYLQEAAMNTINKNYSDSKELTLNLWKKYLISEHSPIRSVDLRIYLYNILVPNSVHFCRHVHAIHYVTTNRPDRRNKKRSLNDKVNHIMDINCQGLIDMMRKRLCNKCDIETLNIAKAIKKHLLFNDNPYLKVLGEVLQSNCEYRKFCPEFKSCGRFENLII